MSAETIWDVRVRKSYSENIQVQAITEADAYEAARKIDGVVMIESVEWNDNTSGDGHE